MAAFSPRLCAAHGMVMTDRADRLSFRHPEAEGSDQHTMDTTLQVDQFDHDQWQVQIFMTWDTALQCLAGRAELVFRSSLKCRIALPLGLQDEEKAIALLRVRAREFIADWQRRDHDADSEFSEL